MADKGPIELAVERKIARKIDGGDPVRDMVIAEVNDVVVAFEDKLLTRLITIEERWTAKQQQLKDRSVKVDDPEYKDAKRIYELQVKSCEHRMINVAKLGSAS